MLRRASQSVSPGAPRSGSPLPEHSASSSPTPASKPPPRAPGFGTRSATCRVRRPRELGPSSNRRRLTSSASPTSTIATADCRLAPRASCYSDRPDGHRHGTVDARLQPQCEPRERRSPGGRGRGGSGLSPSKSDTRAARSVCPASALRRPPNSDGGAGGQRSGNAEPVDLGAVSANCIRGAFAANCCRKWRPVRVMTLRFGDRCGRPAGARSSHLMPSVQSPHAGSHTERHEAPFGGCRRIVHARGRRRLLSLPVAAREDLAGIAREAMSRGRLNGLVRRDEAYAAGSAPRGTVRFSMLHHAGPGPQLPLLAGGAP